MCTNCGNGCSRVTLSDVCEFVAGYAFKSQDFGCYPDKVVKIKDIQPPFVDFTDLQGVNLDNYDRNKLRKYIVSKGDYLLAMTGATIGKIGRIRQGSAYINQRVLVFRPNEQICNKEFLFYVLNNGDFNPFVLNHIDSESAQPNISATTIGTFSFELPAMAEQVKIAHILSSLDAKIELNTRINQNLEAQAQAIFKSWFVDFEPFRNGKFVDSALGLIPEGWRVLPLDEIATFLNGLPMQKYRPSEDNIGLPVLKIKELREQCCSPDSERCTEHISPEYIVGDGDVIFSWSGSLMVDIWSGGRCGLNQHLFKVTSAQFEKWFYYLWTRHHMQNFISIAADKATTMGHIQRGHLHAALTLVPSEQEYSKLSVMLSTIIDRLIQSRIESKHLGGLRDTLLPKLVSGEIDVSEVEV